MTAVHYLLLTLFAVSLVWTAILGYRAWSYGRKLHRKFSRHLLTLHRHYMDCFFVTLLVPVVVVRLLVMYEGGRWGNLFLFNVHAVLIAIFCLSCFGMRFIWTGLTNKKMHQSLAVVTVVSFVCVLITGVVLLGQLFQKYGIF